MAIIPSITTNLEFAVEFGESAQWQDTAQTTAATTSDPLGSWEDQSANGYDAEQGTTANKPVVGSNSIEFDRDNNQFLEANGTAATLTGTNSFSIYIVVDPNHYTSQRPVMFSATKTTDASERFVFRQTATNSYHEFYFSNSSGTATRSSTTAIVEELQVISIIGDGSGVELYVNGASIFTANYVGSSSFDFDRFVIGGYAFGTGMIASLAGDFDLYGFYVYSTEHNDTDRATIEDDLIAAYLNQSLSPDTVLFVDTVHEPTISNTSLQSLSPDTVSFTDTVNNVTIANASAQGLSPDTVSFTDTVNNVTIANYAAQGLTIMGFRKDTRTRLQLIQSDITGLKKAELNVPNVINVSMCPLIVNFIGRTTYTSLEGQYNVSRADIALTMRLYLGVFNTVTAMENDADEFIPLVESQFISNSDLSYGNAPLSNILDFQLLDNSGLISQQYVVNAGDDAPYYAVIEFNARISTIVRNC